MTTDGIVIAQATASLADDLAGLVAESSAVGIRNVTAVAERWTAGTERFDRPGEQLLVAWAGSATIGIGGITQCPDVPGALRVRRFYVSSAHRRRGVARLLAEPLIAAAWQHTDTVTCNARASDAAPPFWESMGFEPVDAAGITHLLRPC